MSRTDFSGHHGGDGRRVVARLGLDPSQVLDLSASLNPFAPAVSDLLVRHTQLVSHYPDAHHCTALIAAEIGVDADRIILTNGGSEAIALTAGLLRSGSISDPEFSLYRRHLNSVSDVSPSEPADDRWRSNPNNPTGELARPMETALVWDEAFYPLATGLWTRSDEASWRLGSLTKLWACPGLRLGYVIAPTVDQANLVRQNQPRWAVNGMALGLIPDLLARTDLPGWADKIGTLRSRFVDELQALGLDVTPSAANWVLVSETSNLKERLAPLGIVIRDCASFGLSDTYRIALPTAKNLDRVLAAISQVSH